MITEQSRKTIEEVEHQLRMVNNDINSRIDEMNMDVQSSLKDSEKNMLREIRNQNIRTINLINELELKGMI